MRDALAGNRQVPSGGILASKDQAHTAPTEAQVAHQQGCVLPWNK